MTKRSPGKSAVVKRDSSLAHADPENRDQRRFAVRLPVRCARVTGRGPGPVRGRTANVSGGGLAVELPARLPPGTRVAIEIRTGIGPLRMETDVVWTRRVVGQDRVTRHGLCLAGRSELIDLPLHALLGEWLQSIARRQESPRAKARRRRPARAKTSR